MNVLVYTHEFPPFLGGLATSSYKLVKGLHARGFDVSALVPSYGKGDREVDRAIEAGVTRIPLLGRRWVKRLPLPQYVLGWVYLTLMLLRKKPDVVLFITEEAEVVGGLLPFYRFKPVTRVVGSGITTIFFSHKPAKNALGYPLKRLYRNAAKVIAVSNSTKELLVGIGVDEEKVAVVYNGVADGFVNLDTGAGRVKSLRGELSAKMGEEGRKMVLAKFREGLMMEGYSREIRSLP